MKILKIIFCTSTLITFFSCSDENSKFNNTQIKTPLKKVKENWGNPDIQFNCEDCGNNLVLKYNKDYLNWETYVFVFDKDSLLIKKTIDE